MNKIFKKILKENSEENWDGFGSKPVTEETVNSAKCFLSSLEKTWIVALNDGSIDIAILENIWINVHGTKITWRIISEK